MSVPLLEQFDVVVSYVVENNTKINRRIRPLSVQIQFWIREFYVNVMRCCVRLRP